MGSRSWMRAPPPQCLVSSWCRHEWRLLKTFKQNPSKLTRCTQGHDEIKEKEGSPGKLNQTQGCSQTPQEYVCSNKEPQKLILSTYFASLLYFFTLGRSGNSYAKVSFGCTCSGSTYTKTVKMQRLASPLRKEDSQIPEASHISTSSKDSLWSVIISEKQWAVSLSCHLCLVSNEQEERLSSNIIIQMEKTCRIKYAFIYCTNTYVIGA